MFEFNITLNDNDYLLFNQYHIFNSTANKKSLRSIKLMLPLICLLFFLKFYSKTDYPLVMMTIMVVFSLFWITYSKKIVLKAMKQSIKKVKKQGRLPYSKVALLRFDDDCIHEITPDNETKTKYSLVEKIAISETAIYIYFSSVQAYIVPMTAFSDEIEKQNLLDFINLKVDTYKNFI